MKMFTIERVVFCLFAVSASSAIHASENIIYGGIGSGKSKSASTTSDKNPMSFGYINASEVRSMIWGLDFYRWW